MRSVWAVDQVAAANMSFALGMTPDSAGAALIAQHFAEHRRTAAALAVRWMRRKIIDQIQRLTDDPGQHRNVDWSMGCLAACGIVERIATAQLDEVTPPAGRSKGQIVRSMIRRARRERA